MNFIRKKSSSPNAHFQTKPKSNDGFDFCSSKTGLQNGLMGDSQKGSTAWVPRQGPTYEFQKYESTRISKLKKER